MCHCFYYVNDINKFNFVECNICFWLWFHEYLLRYLENQLCEACMRIFVAYEDSSWNKMCAWHDTLCQEQFRKVLRQGHDLSFLYWNDEVLGWPSYRNFKHFCNCLIARSRLSDHWFHCFWNNCWNRRYDGYDT